MRLGKRGVSPSIYPVELGLYYKIDSGAEPVTAGEGRTSWISSHELKFTADKVIARGARLKLSIRWPVSLDDAIPLQLSVRGRVTAVDGTRVTMKIEKHDFLTRKAVAHRMAAASGSARLPGDGPWRAA